MLSHGDPRHVMAGGKCNQGLAVPGKQRIKQCPPSRIGEGSEHRLHNGHNRKPNGFLSRVGSRSSETRVHPDRLMINQWLQQGGDL
jgi:hypothetical protein